MTDSTSATTTTYDNVHFRQSQGRMTVSDTGIVFEPYTSSGDANDAMTIPWLEVTQKSFSPPEYYAASIHFFQLETKPGVVPSSHAHATDNAVIFQMANPTDLQRLEQDVQDRENRQHQPLRTTGTNNDGNNGDQTKSGQQEQQQEVQVVQEEVGGREENALVASTAPATGAVVTETTMIPRPPTDETQADGGTTALIPRDATSASAALATTSSSYSPWALAAPTIDTTVRDSTYHPVWYKDQIGKLVLTPYGFTFTPNDPGLLLHKKYHFKLDWKAMGNPEYSPYNFAQALVRFSYLAHRKSQNMTSKRAGFELSNHEELKRLQRELAARRGPWEGHYQDARRRANMASGGDDDDKSTLSQSASGPRKLISMVMSLVRLPQLTATESPPQSAAATRALATIPEGRGGEQHDDEDPSESMFSETSDDYYPRKQYPHHDDDAYFHQPLVQNKKDDPWRVRCLFCCLFCVCLILWLCTSALLGYLFLDDDFPDSSSAYGAYYPPEAEASSLLQNAGKTSLPPGLEEPQWTSEQAEFTKIPAAWLSEHQVLTKSPQKQAEDARDQVMNEIEAETSPPETESETSPPTNPPTPFGQGKVPPFLTLLVNHSFDRGVAVKLEGTPQFHAHAIMEADYGFDEVDDEDFALEKFAFFTLYISMTGNEGQGLDASQWSGPKPQVCSWHGVDCDEETHKHIIGLDLHDKNLKGRIPDELAYLTKLTELDLHDNSLTGAVPSTLASLTDLQMLDVSHNQLSGIFPQAVIDLPSLDSLIAYPNANIIMP